MQCSLTEPRKLFNQMQQQTMIKHSIRLLVLDTRDREPYLNGHVSGAVNLPSTRGRSTSLSRSGSDPVRPRSRSHASETKSQKQECLVRAELLVGNGWPRRKFMDRRLHHVVIYTSAPAFHAPPHQGEHAWSVQLALALLKENIVASVSFLKGGYETWEAIYPFLSSTWENRPLFTKKQAIPSARGISSSDQSDSSESDSSESEMDCSPQSSSPYMRSGITQPDRSSVRRIASEPTLDFMRKEALAHEAESAEDHDVSPWPVGAPDEVLGKDDAGDKGDDEAVSCVSRVSRASPHRGISPVHILPKLSEQSVELADSVDDGLVECVAVLQPPGGVEVIGKPDAKSAPPELETPPEPAPKMESPGPRKPGDADTTPTKSATSESTAMAIPKEHSSAFSPRHTHRRASASHSPLGGHKPRKSHTRRASLQLPGLYQVPEQVSYPSEVLSGGLYLGNDVDAQSETVVRNLGITHIVNATRNIPNAFEHVKYHNVSCHDDQKTDIMKFLDGVYTFVSGALKEKGTVLVHCNKGISRSSTCVIWLCLKLREAPPQCNTVKLAYAYVLSCRSCCHPNSNFIKQLLAHENDSCGVASSSVSELRAMTPDTFSTLCPEYGSTTVKLEDKDACTIM